MNTDRHEPTPVTFGLTLMRVVLAIVVAGRALENLIHLRGFQAELITVGVPQAELAAVVIVALEFAVSLSLLMGRFVRVAALGALFDACMAVALIGLQHRALELHMRLESAALMGAASVFCSLQYAVDPR